MFSDYLPALSCLTDLSSPANFHENSMFKLAPDTLLDHCSSIISAELCNFASSEYCSSLFMLTIKPGSPYLTYLLHSTHALTTLWGAGEASPAYCHSLNWIWVFWFILWTDCNANALFLTWFELLSQPWISCWAPVAMNKVNYVHGLQIIGWYAMTCHRFFPRLYEPKHISSE